MTILDKSVSDILDTNALYDIMINRWQLWGSAYEGATEFLKIVIKQHERESTKNFNLRLEEGEVFNYSETIVNIFGFFMTQVAPHRQFDPMEGNTTWETFMLDVDLEGTDYDVYWNNSSKLASVYGFVGILVDRPQGRKGTTEKRTQADDLADNIYPYLVMFTPENILDWKWERNKETARFELTYIKLRESEDSVLAWSLEEWERWERVEATWNISESGTNPLGVIPFVWYPNYTNLKKPKLGISDIKNVAPIQASVTRDLSNGTEVIKYAAFPMMRKPFSVAKPTDDDDTSGVTSILQFDPEFADSKPDWLEAEVKEPIEAILQWLENKAKEVYRVAHLSSVYGQKSEQAKSGIALRYEFQQLSAVLSAKNKGLDEAEVKAIYYWMLWQNMEDRFTDIKVTRPNAFNIDDLTMQLDNILAGTQIVHSDRFKKVIQKKIVRLLAPEENEDIIEEIDKEIEAYVEPEPLDITGTEEDVIPDDNNDE